jgi:hypothetical protein
VQGRDRKPAGGASRSAKSKAPIAIRSLRYTAAIKRALFKRSRAQLPPATLD